MQQCKGVTTGWSDRIMNFNNINSKKERVEFIYIWKYESDWRPQCDIFDFIISNDFCNWVSVASMQVLAKLNTCSRLWRSAHTLWGLCSSSCETIYFVVLFITSTNRSICESFQKNATAVLMTCCGSFWLLDWFWNVRWRIWQAQSVPCIVLHLSWAISQSGKLVSKNACMHSTFSKRLCLLAGEWSWRECQQIQIISAWMSACNCVVCALVCIACIRYAMKVDNIPRYRMLIQLRISRTVSTNIPLANTHRQNWLHE